MVAPKTSSQKRRHGFAGFGVQAQKTNQQNSQSKRSARSCPDQGDSWAALWSGFTGVFVSMADSAANQAERQPWLNRDFSWIRDHGQEGIRRALDFKAVCETVLGVFLHRGPYLGRSRQPASEQICRPAEIVVLHVAGAIGFDFAPDIYLVRNQDRRP